MKRIDLLITLTLAIFLLASIADAQRTSRITRPCPASTTPAVVELDRDGDIAITPCSGRSVSTGGLASTLKFLDPNFVSPYVATKSTRFTVGSTTAFEIPTANNYEGIEFYQKIFPQNTTSKVFTGVRNTLHFDGASGTGGGLILGLASTVNSSATWISGPLSDVVGVYGSVDIGAQGGASGLYGGQFSALVGSVNVGAVTDVVGVSAAGSIGYSATVTNGSGLKALIQGGSNFGGVTTHAAALWAQRRNFNTPVTNAYGLRIGGYTGSGASITNNYAIHIDNTVDAGTNQWAIYSQSVAQSFLSGKLAFDATYTAGGTTGNQTINKPAFSVNFAAAASSLTVTNSFVTTASMLICTVQTNDGTLKSVAAVAGSGSVVLHGNAAATAETKVYCEVRN